MERFARIGAAYIVTCIVGGLAVTGAGLLAPAEYAPLGTVLVLAGGVAIGIGALGIGIDVREWWREKDVAGRDAALREYLSDMLTKGNKASIPMDDLDIDAMDTAYRIGESWATEIKERLDAERPGWSAIFLDDTFGAQYFATNVPRKATLSNWYERRLTRLRDLLMRLTH